MDEEKLRLLIEGTDPKNKIPEETIQELLALIRERENNPLKDGDTKTIIDENGNEKIITFRSVESELQEKMSTEPDWRKRAAIAAKIISHSLDY